MMERRKEANKLRKEGRMEGRKEGRNEVSQGRKVERKEAKE